MSDAGHTPPSITPIPNQGVILKLEDLLPDPGGEIVVRSTGLEAIGVVTNLPVTETGTAAAHVTAAGEDVAGFRFYRLDGGPTLYCAADTSLVLGPDLV